MLILAGLLGMVALGSVMMIEPSSDSDADDPLETGDDFEDTHHRSEQNTTTDFLTYVDEDGVTQTESNEVTEGNDKLIGSNDADSISSIEGDDKVMARAGNDTVSGGAGDDVIHGNEGNDALSGDDGLDALFGDTGDDTLAGHIGDDTLIGNSGADQLLGGFGDDNLIGGEGRDGLFGDSGDDTLVANDGDDTLNGGAGRDLLMAGSGNDMLNGVEDGEQSADFLNGGDGDDTIFAGAGDQVSGGNGADTTVLGSDITEHAQIWDFESGLDTLVVLYDDENMPEIDISESPDTAGHWVIHADGETVAHISGDVPTLADINLIARS